MRAFALSALSALILASAFPVAFLGCNQDYASSTASRETFMGDTKEVVSDAAAPKAVPMAPPQMGSPPPPVQSTGDASADAASDAARAPAAPRPAPPAPPVH